MTESKAGGGEYLTVFGEINSVDVILKFKLRSVKWSDDLEARTLFDGDWWNSEEDKAHFGSYVPEGMFLAKVELSYDF